MYGKTLTSEFCRASFFFKYDLEAIHKPQIVTNCERLVENILLQSNNSKSVFEKKMLFNTTRSYVSFLLDNKIEHIASKTKTFNMQVGKIFYLILASEKIIHSIHSQILRTFKHTCAKDKENKL